MDVRWFIDKIAGTQDRYPDEVFSSSNKFYTCLNPFSYHLIRRNPELFKRLDGLFIDGMTMCWAVRALWGLKITRLSFDMTGIAPDLFAFLNDKATDRTIYFIGSRQPEVEAAVKQISKNYPNIKVAGYRNGYFSSPEERREALREIVETAPDFTIVGMGSPLQEQFVVDLKDAGYKGNAFTCGGFLHQTTERINYYPDWINRYNLRAFYRLFKEKGLYKRLWKILVTFPIIFSYDSILTKLSKK